MKKIDFNSLLMKNDNELENFIKGVEREMEFIKYGDNYIIKDSNGKVVSEEEKLKLERNELILENDECNCPVEQIKKKSKINRKINKIEKDKEVVDDTIEETGSTI